MLKRHLHTLKVMAWRQWPFAPLRSAFERIIAREFHKVYYSGEVWYRTFWLGHQVLKCPFDLWIYQEIIFALRPEVIIECGTFAGGGTLFLASMCDLVGTGRIVSIDIEERNDRPLHPRITYVLGSSTAPETIDRVKGLMGDAARVLVILDSDHTKDHVLKELELYHGFVTPGSFLIVEDTNINGHPACGYYGPGPMEALREFQKTNRDFTVDKEKEKFRLTFNPKGYLRCILNRREEGLAGGGLA